MVQLNQWKQYWTGIVERTTDLNGVHFVTEEADIKEVLPELGPNKLPFLLVLTPSAKTRGVQDSFRDENLCLIYLLTKEDAYSKSTFEIQELLQPIIEEVKNLMIQDKEGCTIMRDLDVSGMHTDPEKKMFTKLTGWSLSFTM